MRGSRISAIFIAVAIWGCQGSGMSPGVPGDAVGNEPEESSGPRTGGATGDFGGDCDCDRMLRELELSEADSVLGFSAEDVLAKIEGEYVLSMAWGDACTGASAPDDGCNSEAPAVVGTTTDVQLVIVGAAMSARVDECNRGGAPQCHITWMTVSVSGSLSTSDGLLDAPFEIELQTSSADDVTIGQQLEAEDVGGALAEHVPGLAGIEWAFGVDATRAWFEVFVLTAPENGLARLVSQPAPGGRTPIDHSWGVEADLEQARQ